MGDPRGHEFDRVVTSKELLRKVRTLTFDSSKQAANEARSERGSVSCAQGCGYCCYQKILASPGRGAMLHLWLKSKGQWTAATKSRLREADRAMSAETCVEWLSHRHPCVFLVEQSFGRGSCSVYPVRPVGCLTTFSSGDPADCADDDKGPRNVRRGTADPRVQEARAHRNGTFIPSSRRWAARAHDPPGRRALGGGPS